MESTTASPASIGSNSAPTAFKTQDELRIRQLLRDLHVDTGDVVLFDRKCSAMGVYGGAICMCAKFFGQTQWDHNGIIVRVPSLAPDAQSPEDQLFVLEAALTGVKLRPLVARVLLSRGHEVSLRKLQVPRTPELQNRAVEFALSSLNAPYEDNPAKFFNAGVSVPKRIARERIFAALMSLKKERARLDTELEHRDKMPAFERKALLQEREAVSLRYQALGAKLRRTERSVFENAVVEGEVKTTKMFCSQLVARMYQHLGLLLPYPSANSYLPKHFSARDGGDFLKLQQGASFLTEISLRQKLEKQAEMFATRAQEAKERGPRTAKETATIVHCLRRHQLFHTLSEPELLATASQFRRRVLAKEEVVFYQGAPGDCFYIIERGDCDVFVDYDHLLKTQTALDSNNASSSELQQRIALNKRKTIALPEFKTSSSLVGKNERVHVATKGPGNAFGESALIYDTPRRATIQASSSNSGDEEQAVVLWQLGKLAFREVLARHPGTQQSLEERRFLLGVLEDHPLFAELDDHAKALAVRKCFPLSVRAGTTILRQGDPGDYFYLVESGLCEVSRRKPKAAKPFVDRVIGRGASFGEAALLYNSRRGASVKVLEDAKIWCMDRASFVTITRSGSSALHRIFRKVGTTVVSGLSESFATERDLRRMLADPQQMQLVTHSANEDDDGNNNTEEFGTVVAHPTPLPSGQAYNRAVQLALSLLLNDPSGLVNFSQFAHFHIALGATSIDQLLPEAAFRVLKSVTESNDGGSTRTTIPSTLPSLFDQDTPHQSAIKLYDVPRALHQWVSICETAGAASKELETPVQMTPGRLAFYESLFDLPAHQFGDQYVTHDDLVRGITAFEMENARSESEQGDNHPPSEDIAAAKEEFRAFLTALKSDISALRTIWRAAELQAHGGDRDGIFSDQQKLSFDASLKTGWISAFRQNPTGSDWEYLQPEMDNNSQRTAYSEISAKIERQQLTAQVTLFAAAIAAGALVRTVCAPLERLKMLMQLSAPKPAPASGVNATAKLLSGTAPYTSLTRGFLNMVKLSGPRSLFSGNLTHCIWMVPSVPTKLILCHIYQEQLGRLLPESPSPFGAIRVGGPRVSATMANLAVGGLFGLTLNCLLYPLDVIRGRLTVQQYYNANRPSSGIVDCARLIRDKEGLRGFYRGFVPTSLGVFIYIGCNFTFYGSLRPIFVLYDREDTSNQFGHPSVPGQILCATTASLASQSISYPFDVIRRRVQLRGAKWHPELAFPTYKSAWHCVKSSVEEEGGGVRGLRSLYRGLFVNAVKALPSTMISFVSYEKLHEMKHSVDDA